MNAQDFHKLVHVVLDSEAAPPANLFIKGYDDWHARARLAHFLAMPELKHLDDAIELFRSVVEIEIDEENAEDIEEKVYALQKLSFIRRDQKDYKAALKYINLAVETAESSDFLYKYILRGELWADRWNLLHLKGEDKEAEQEADERIAAFEDIPIHFNSYLYYGYRFKAQLAAEREVPLVAKDYMHMALKYVDLPANNKADIDDAFKQTHANISWILNAIDRAMPPLEHLNWDI